MEVSYLNNNCCHLSKRNAVAPGKNSIENTVKDTILTSFKRSVFSCQVDGTENFSKNLLVNNVEIYIKVKISKYCQSSGPVFKTTRWLHDLIALRAVNLMDEKGLQIFPLPKF